MKKTRFVIIHFSTKKKFELSLNEYALLELVYYYSTNPESSQLGWCYASKKHLGECIDLSSRTVIKLLNKLEEDGFIEKQMDGKLVKTTRKWNMTKFTQGEESSQGSEESSQGSEESSVQDGEESSHEPVKKVHTNSISNSTEFNNTVKEIIDYLNLKAKTSFRSSSKKTKSLVKARMDEKFTVDDFKKVIDNMVSKWLKDSKMCEYLRPITLFGTKFESYLQVKVNLPVGSVKEFNYGTNETWK